MAKSWRKNNTFDGYRRLCAAVIIQALRNYMSISQALDEPTLTVEKSITLEQEIYSLEQWLFDPMNPFSRYLDLDPSKIITQVDKLNRNKIPDGALPPVQRLRRDAEKPKYG